MKKNLVRASVLKGKEIFFTYFFLILGALIPEAYAENDSYLFGDWNGNRTCLEDKGITFESVLTYDVMRNVRGGIRPGTAGLSNYNITANVDFDKLEMIKGGTFFTYFIGNSGHSPSNNYIGDYQVVNNIDTFSTFKLYEMWYQQNFMDDQLSVLFGVHDYNSEFDVLNYGINLIGSSFGMGPDIAQVPPSNFPSTTLGVRVRYEPTEDTYALLAVYDGFPGDATHQAGTRISFDKGDGAFTAYEVGYMEDSEVTYKKFAVGGWYSTRTYDDFSETSRNNNSGVYILTEAKLYDEGNEDAQGLGFFNALGFARADRNQTDFYAGGGLTYQGLIPERDSDIFSVGFAYVHNSHDFVEVNSGELLEKTIEVLYKAQITDYFAIAPDFQYVFNPGMDSSLKDAVVIGLRTELAM